MGIATLRAGANGSHRKVKRLFALFTVFTFGVMTLMLSFAPSVSAAATYNWVNDTVIETKDWTEPWNPRVIQTIRFTDSNPYDNNRTFKAPAGRTYYCANNLVDTITLSTPSSGRVTYVTTTPPSDTEDKVNCATESTGISIGSVNNGRNYGQPCTQQGSNAEQRCAEQRANGNAEWVRRCGFMGLPGTPTPAPGTFCTDNSGTPTPPAGAPAGGGTTRPPDICDSLGEFSMRWVACPILKATVVLVEEIDDQIAKNLHYDTTIFDRNSDTGKSYYSVWSTFRNIALALVLVVGLVMVVSQASGLQFFDAYTVKKVMPRLLVAVIAITLSWPLLELVITFFNDIGHWIQSIILWPFQAAANPTNSSDAAEWTGIGVALAAAVTGSGAYLVSLGAGGIMALVGTVGLALFIGLLIIVARNIIITIVIIFAPLAIACYILPNTKKLFDFWQNALVTMLIIFFIIMALIGVGKAMSFATPQGLIKILLYILPYFFIPFAFKLAGGLMSTVFSLFNDKGQGLFGGLKNARRNQQQERAKRFMDGRLFNDNADGTQGWRNKVGLYTGAFMRAERKGQFLASRSVRSQAKSTQERLAAMRQANTDEAKLTQHDDPQLRAQMFGSEAAARAGLASMYGMKEPEINSAIAAAKANGGFSQASRIRAFEAAAASGTAFNNWNDALSLGSDIAGGNQALRGQMAAMLKQRSVAAGRVDFGASIGDIYNAMGDVHEKGSASRYLNGVELTTKAALGQDATSIVRGKKGALENISRVLTTQIKDANTKVLRGDKGAEEDLAILTAAVDKYAQNVPYASMDNTYTLRQEVEGPTREIKANVERATQEYAADRRPIMVDIDGEIKQAQDTFGNRLFERLDVPGMTIPPRQQQQQVNVSVGAQQQQGQTPAPGTPPDGYVRSRRNVQTGDLGYQNSRMDQQTLTNIARDLRRLNRPYDPQNPDDPNRRM